MTEISATDASRNFADLLDAVEHEDADFTIVRRGRTVARLTRAPGGNGAAVRRLFETHEPDPEWMDEVRAARALLRFETDH